MDYSTSPDTVVDPGTGHRLHQDNQAVTSEWTAKDANSLIWSAMAILNAAGIAGVQFDPAVPGSYDRMLVALRKLFLRADIDANIPDAAGATRLRFNSGGTSRVRGYGSFPFEVIGGDDLSKFFINSDGRATAAANAINSLDLVTLQQLQSAVNAAVNTRTGHVYADPDWVWKDKANGIIEQWGLMPYSVVGHSATNAVAVTFTQAMTTCLDIQVSFTQAGGGCSIRSDSPTGSGFTGYYANLSGATAGLQGRYRAIGKI